MNLSLERKVFSGFTLVVIVLMTLAYFSFQNNQSNNQMSKQAVHTNKVLYQLEQLLSLSVNMETGLRGYMLTDDTLFLQPYYKSKNALQENMASLQHLLKNNREQLRKLNVVQLLLEEKISRFNRLIANPEDAEQVRNDKNFWYRSKLKMDKIRTTIALMKEHESMLLTQQIRDTGGVQERYSWWLLGSFAFMILVLSGTYVLIHVNLKARTLAENKLKKDWEMFQSVLDKASAVISIKDLNGKFLLVNNQFLKFSGKDSSDILNKTLFDMISREEAERQDQFDKMTLAKNELVNQEMSILIHGEPKTFIITKFPLQNELRETYGICTISTDISERKRNEEKIEQLNKKLSENILQLETSNQELESFTYSVSHDLRAPLRSIDGYARILEEDYNDKLDEEGKRILSVVMKNARRMAELIDDLLAFSRIGKLDISKTDVNMKELVDQVLQDFEGNTIRVENIPLAYADPNMIRQVWVNLIHNAVKYSSKTETPEIVVGSKNEAGKTVFFVRDNGVGFDMKYVHKLFGVFQRLHSMEEFEGTGVGLAMVQRIVHKHGGEVWAESNPGKGATFYFTLA